jgi:hypothetical protein
MSTTHRVTNRLLRIEPEEIKHHLEAGEPVTILDVRAPKAWDASDRKLPGAVRGSAEALNIELAWPRDRLTVAYCT